jgi:hypothetical protein
VHSARLHHWLIAAVFADRAAQTGLAPGLTWAVTDVTLFHWQDRSGAEVDIILEPLTGG